MKLLCLMLLIMLHTHSLVAQKQQTVSIAFVNTGTAYPFAQFGKLVTQSQHPGFELGYSFNWTTKSKHDWYQECKLAYFYHRFVQQAIPLYTDIGYRYKYKNVTLQVAAGAGYMHSIPATAKLKLMPDGSYKNNKGVGKAQAMAVANLALSYMINASAKRPAKIFTSYQQLLQTPFVKEYVPVLPYNSFMIGYSVLLMPIKK